VPRTQVPLTANSGRGSLPERAGYRAELDRLAYRRKRVDGGLEEAPVLWTESEAVQKAEHCQLAAAMDADNRRGRIMRLLWRFQRTLELSPLTPERLRDYQHEAAAVYWDMPPLLSIAVIAFMAIRYVSRGIGETEFLVLSGVGSALFWGLIALARRLGR
jgi:hypothetical protein